MGQVLTAEKAPKVHCRAVSDFPSESETPCTSKPNTNVESLSTYLLTHFKDVDFSIFDDLLVDILSYVSAEDLITNCRLVCKEWEETIEGHSVWKIKCQRENKCIPDLKFKQIPKHYYRKIYVFNPYGRNLLENPCGEDGLNSWNIIANGSGEGFLVENPPQGADPVPAEVGSQSCFATTYDSCCKYQLVDLIGLGIPEEVLKLETTKIEIGEWYAARFDCSSEYQLVVSLEEKRSTKQSMKSKNLKPYVEPVTFEFSYTEEQWVGKQWHKITHTFENIGDARYVYFQHYGKDRQFWAGHYGCKMTGSFVRVIV